VPQYAPPLAFCESLALCTDVVIELAASAALHMSLPGPNAT
jgi:hypothetical protein